MFSLKYMYLLDKIFWMKIEFINISFLYFLVQGSDTEDIYMSLLKKSVKF